MEPRGSTAGSGDEPTYHSHHRRLQGNNLFVPAVLRGSPLIECSLLPQHFLY